MGKVTFIHDSYITIDPLIIAAALTLLFLGLAFVLYRLLRRH